MAVATERRTRKDDTAPHCSRCGTEMKDVVTIAPLADEPGLIAYECPNCGHLTSVLIPAAHSEVP